MKQTSKPSDKRGKIEFEAMVRKDGVSGCWVWAGNRQNARGYGQWRFRGVDRAAHHIAMYLYKGVPFETYGRLIHTDHLCRRPSCVNPDHLEVVSSKENNRRGNSITAAFARATHCKKGHEFTPENTKIVLTPHGTGRSCRICKRARYMKWEKANLAKGLTSKGTIPVRVKDNAR